MINAQKKDCHAAGHRATFSTRWMLVFLVFASCENFVDINSPVTSLTGDTVFDSDETANAAMVGEYIKMMQVPTTLVHGFRSVSWFMGLAADELENYSPDRNQFEFYDNNLLVSNIYIKSRWDELYNYIYTANFMLEGLAAATDISDEVAQQLEGEARFMRAWCYFYLVNLHAGVPLIVSTDFNINKSIGRSSESEVYDLMMADLAAAGNLLGEAYVSSEGRVRPNKYTVTALLARVFLYQAQWVNAEAKATEVIESGLYHLEANLNDVFLVASEEAIWQLQSIRDYYCTFDGAYFILTGPPPRVALRNDFVADFQKDDLRFTNWVSSIVVGSQTYYFPFKYKVRLLPTAQSTKTEHLTVFRLSELYLIRAEARAQQSKISDALSDLNRIRNRAGLSDLETTSAVALLDSIMQERRFELFTEFGHRWFDLKRTQRADAVLGALKSGWNATDVLLPLPEEEISRNPNLGPQNPGY